MDTKVKEDSLAKNAPGQALEAAKPPSPVEWVTN
jgi:hypothetical protein